jgi:iron complex transport system substrate-binding protein
LVALTPSLVETTYALGLGDRLVGITRFATFPQESAKKPKVGDFLQPNLELILSLRPELVLLDPVQASTRTALHTAGIRTLALPMASIADVQRAIHEIGAATGASVAATRLLAQLDADLLEARRPSDARRPRVLFAVDRELGSLRNLVAAGPGTYLDELVRRAGGENVLADAASQFVRVAPEELIARRPDVIFDAVHTADSRRAGEDWSVLTTVPAVTRGRVHVLSDSAFVTPGPRLGRALQELTRLLHPADGGLVLVTPDGGSSGTSGETHR